MGTNSTNSSSDDEFSDETVIESNIIDELIPTSTVDNEGIVEVIASISRIIDRGE